MAKKDTERLEIHRPEEYKITILVPEGYEWLRDQVHPWVRAKVVQYFDLAEFPEKLAEAGIEDAVEDVTEPIVLVSVPGEKAAAECAISAIGESVIIHCELGIVPLAGRGARFTKRGQKRAALPSLGARPNG